MRYMSLCRALWSRHDGHVAYLWKSSLERKNKNDIHDNFYRLTFSAKCPVDGYWWVDFFDKDGVQLPDVNSRLYASDDWTSYDVMIPARPDAAFAQKAWWK